MSGRCCFCGGPVGPKGRACCLDCGVEGPIRWSEAEAIAALTSTPLEREITAIVLHGCEVRDVWERVINALHRAGRLP